MSLLIESVELSNIRSHEHFVFTPKEKGVTAIAGPNGTGKSTIVDSIAWCLFGTKPDGVSKSSSIIKNKTDFKKEKVFVKIVISINGVRYSILRKMIHKSGAAECSVSKINEDDSEEIVAGPAVSHAEPFIRKLLQMDEKGFLSAILVQQKQVDKLIVATPRERGAVIEKLMGISSITSAITESRQELNTLKKLSSVTTFDESVLAENKMYLKKISEEKKTVESSIQKKEKTVSELRDSKESLDNFIKEETSKIEQNLKNTMRVSTLKEIIESKETDLKQLVKDKDEKKKNLPPTVSEKESDELKNRYQELSDEKQNKWEEAHSLKTKIKDTKLKLTEAEEIISSSKVKELDEALANSDNFKKELEKIESKKKKVEERISLFNYQISSIDSAIKVIEEKDGHCPTCLQQVQDVVGTVETLTKNKKELSELLEENSDELKDVNLEIRKKTVIIEKYDVLINHLSNFDSYKGQLSELKKDFDKSESEYKAINLELSSIEKTLIKLKENEVAYREYNSLLSKAQRVSEEVNNYKKELIELGKNKIKVIDDSILADKKSKLDKCRNDLLTISSDLASEKGNLNLINERLDSTKSKIESLEDEKKKFQKLLKDLEVLNNTTKVLEEFKADRVDKSVPLIENYSSELLSRFTEGQFTRLKLDSKFKATVVLSDGTERDVGLLSGGEMSAAAMALRLSISMVLSGNSSQNVIILDEVLVSQDSSRAEQILSIIKDVCNGQVIFIAHNDSINDIADELVELS